MRSLSALAALAFLTAGSSLATAAPGDRIGSAVKVIDLVTATMARDTRTLAVNDGVRQSELIEVGQNGTSELALNDDTKLALGPGAKLLLDKFVYDPDKTANAIVVNIAKGAFRWITGIAAKPAYVVRVPQASITVRGTIFDLYVQENGKTWLLLHEGAVRICNDRGKCRDHDEPGKLVEISETGDVGSLVRWASLDGRQGFDFDDGFPFVVSPPSIDPNPVFTKADITGESKSKPERSRRTEKTEPEPKPRKVQKAEMQDVPQAKVKPRARQKQPEQAPPKVRTVKVKDPKVVDVVPPRIKPPRVFTKTPKYEEPDDDARDEDDDTPRNTRIIRNAAVVVPLILNRIRERNRQSEEDSGYEPSRIKPTRIGTGVGMPFPSGHRPPMGSPRPMPMPKPMPTPKPAPMPSLR